MIDNKKIEEAAKAYGENNAFSVIGRDGRMSLEPELENAFETGAHWALNKFLKELWYPAEEEPKEKDKLLMVETGKNEHKYVHFKRNQGCLFGEWKHYVHMVDVSRWLYMDDLFQKKGDKE